MTTNWLRDLGLDTLKLPPLAVGAHDDPSKGLCAMEMVAFMERLPHSDRPECTSPVVAQLVIWINDTLPDDVRPQLMPWLPRVVGTVAPQLERVRAYAILQAVFDVATWARQPRILDKHMHDEVTGRRIAFPPWDYAGMLDRAATYDRGFYGRHDPVLLDITRRRLRGALVARDPVDAVGHALDALTMIRNLMHRDGYWAREPVRVAFEPVVSFSVESMERLPPLQVQVIDYHPNWMEWRFNLLEHVLAIGPQGQGFTAPPAVVKQRAALLSDLV